MPRRETIQQKDKVLISLGTVNQRINDVELPDSDYSNIEGTFPEFSGLQSKIWGKRTLAKFATAVKGIYQFWTPLGYAGGIYQFTGELDFGKWLTPISKFPSLTLPPAKPFDASGYTLDDFGWSNGINFGIGDTGATGANLPDDNNGGPAGQGTHCEYVIQSQAYSQNSYIISSGALEQDIGTVSTDTLRTPPNAAPPPATGYIPLPAFQAATNYTTAGAIDNTCATSLDLQSYASGVNQRIAQIYSNTRSYFDFTSLKATYEDLQDVNVYLTVDQAVNGVSIGYTSFNLGVNFADGGNYNAIPFNSYNYLPAAVQVTYGPGLAGLRTRQAAVLPSNAITITWRERVCQ